MKSDTNWWCRICGWFPCPENWTGEYPQSYVTHACKPKMSEVRNSKPLTDWEVGNTLLCSVLDPMDQLCGEIAGREKYSDLYADLKKLRKGLNEIHVIPLMGDKAIS